MLENYLIRNALFSVTVHKPLTVRDGPLEKLGGGGEFSSRRNFFLLSNSLYEFF